mgnify:CR=1 FL=1
MLSVLKHELGRLTLVIKVIFYLALLLASSIGVGEECLPVGESQLDSVSVLLDQGDDRKNVNLDDVVDEAVWSQALSIQKTNAACFLYHSVFSTAINLATFQLIRAPPRLPV